MSQNDLLYTGSSGCGEKGEGGVLELPQLYLDLEVDREQEEGGLPRVQELE